MKHGYCTYPLARLGMTADEAEAWAARVNEAAGSRSAFVSGGTNLVLTEALSKLARL